MNEEMKKWIDDSSYETLLQHWKFAKVGDPFFQGEMGDYYKEIMFLKRNELPHQKRVEASKNVGWEKP